MGRGRGGDQVSSGGRISLANPRRHSLTHNTRHESLQRGSPAKRNGDTQNGNGPHRLCRSPRGMRGRYRRTVRLGRCHLSFFRHIDRNTTHSRCHACHKNPMGLAFCLQPYGGLNPHTNHRREAARGHYQMNMPLRFPPGTHTPTLPPLADGRIASQAVARPHAPDP